MSVFGIFRRLTGPVVQAFRRYRTGLKAEGLYIGKDVLVQGSGRVVVGKNTIIGPNTTFTLNHAVLRGAVRDGRHPGRRADGHGGPADLVLDEG